MGVPVSSSALWWHHVVAVWAQTHSWALTAAQHTQYATALAQLADVQAPTAQMHTILNYYHHDHRAVEALRDKQHPDHAEQWQQWMAQVLKILRRERLDWASDVAVDLEDLAQIAVAELVRALPTYRYRSRFSVWVYSVAVLALRRYVRDSQRARRAERPVSLDQLTAHAEPFAPSMLDPAVQGVLFYEQIQAVLAAHPDQRLAEIFHLAQIEDQRINDIGIRVQLHPSRVRVLLKQAQQLLAAHPTILAWAVGQSDGVRV
jgi:RNA polymerase sigma factor (sigma-70 family)